MLSYLRCLCQMLKNMRTIAIIMPIHEMVLMQMNRGNDTVLKTRRTIVLSCGTCKQERLIQKLNSFINIYSHYLLSIPFFFVEPGQIICLSVIISQLVILTIDHLFDLCQSDSIPLGTEGHNTLEGKANYLLYPETQHR